MDFSRAIRTRQLIGISGTTPLDENDKTIDIGHAFAQARRSLEITRSALRQLGADLRNMHRTRKLLTSIDDWEAVARVHGEFFADIRPANTIMQITRITDSDCLIEFEVDA